MTDEGTANRSPGRPPDEAESRSITLRLRVSPECYDLIEWVRLRSDETFSALVRRLIKQEAKRLE